MLRSALGVLIGAVVAAADLALDPDWWIWSLLLAGSIGAVVAIVGEALIARRRAR